MENPFGSYNIPKTKTHICALIIKETVLTDQTGPPLLLLKTIIE